MSEPSASLFAQQLIREGLAMKIDAGTPAIDIMYTSNWLDEVEGGVTIGSNKQGVVVKVTKRP